MAAALAIALAGPGRYSVDAATGLRLPSSLVAAVAVAAAGGVAAGATGVALPGTEHEGEAAA
jgi:putative oxidoreductase